MTPNMCQPKQATPTESTLLCCRYLLHNSKRYNNTLEVSLYTIRPSTRRPIPDFENLLIRAAERNFPKATVDSCFSVLSITVYPNRIPGIFNISFSQAPSPVTQSTLRATVNTVVSEVCHPRGAPHRTFGCLTPPTRADTQQTVRVGQLFVPTRATVTPTCCWVKQAWSKSPSATFRLRSHVVQSCSFNPGRTFESIWSYHPLQVRPARGSHWDASHPACDSANISRCLALAACNVYLVRHNPHMLHLGTVGMRRSGVILPRPRIA